MKARRGRSDLPTTLEIRAAAQQVLEENWTPSLRCTLPHKSTYPHQWLWDSCFHAIAWAALSRPEAIVEIESLLTATLPTTLGRGFLPHMMYGDPEREGGKVRRGQLHGRSSFTQPPVYVLALFELLRNGMHVDPWVLREAESALAWLWDNRLRDGLLTIVHPWESGADISPRFDDWYGELDFGALHEHYDALVETTEYDAVGVAVGNTRFVVAPAAFNAIAADAAARLAMLIKSRTWQSRAAALSDAIDDQLWSADQALWGDRPDVLGRAAVGSSETPTLDGALAALGTRSTERARAALQQCVGLGRFAAPYGPRYLEADHPHYDPDTYWRGPTWPQLNYLLIVAARKHGLVDIAHELSRCTIRGAWMSGFSEHWNPETGRAGGATPQSWAALVVALLDAWP